MLAPDTSENATTPADDPLDWIFRTHDPVEVELDEHATWLATPEGQATHNRIVEHVRTRTEERSAWAALKAFDDSFDNLDDDDPRWEQWEADRQPYRRAWEATLEAYRHCRQPVEPPPPSGAPMQMPSNWTVEQKAAAMNAPLPSTQPAATTAMVGGARPEIDIVSDEGLALQFARQHRDHLRYVAKWGAWMEWDGQRWRQDDTLSAYDLVRHTVRDTAVNLDIRDAKNVASAKTVAAVERLAKADRALAATIDQWDADLWALNTPGGIVDLHSGEIRPAEPEDYCTRITAVAPGGDCPTWLGFLARVTGCDAELMAFLQRIAGYALTGVTTEHAMFFAHGTGGNGKSVFANTLASVLGDYATTAPIETFIASNTERHPTDLAGLMGARLVTAVETEQGRRWAEAKIKAITGGDRVKARFMRQDFFEFTPQFKLLTVGNHKPGLRSVDEAMRRRMNLLPFTVTIPAAERDPYLSERLRAEWPGILAWAIQGCLAWQRNGLQPPAAVRAATDDYLSAEDALGTWLEERCHTTEAAWESAGRLFADWTGWANRAGEFVGSQKQFSQKLLDRGYGPAKRNGVRGFSGLATKPIEWMVPPLPAAR